MRATLFVFAILLNAILISDAMADPTLPLPSGVPVCGDQDSPPVVFNCSQYAWIPNIQTFQARAGSGRLRFDIVFSSTDFRNEIGVFRVDDSAGSIGSLRPGDPGYVQAAFGRASVVFARGSSAPSPDVTLSALEGDILVFFLIQNGTVADFIQNNPANELTASPVAFFSLDALNPDGVDHFVAFSSRDSSEFAFEDATGGYDFDYNDVVVTASPTLARPVGLPVCGDQDGSPPLVLNCNQYTMIPDVQTFQVRDSSGSVRYDMVLNFTDFRNELGVFRVDDSAGSIGSLRPGDPGYLQAAVGRASIILPRGSSASSPDVTVPALEGDILVFFLIQNGTVTDFIQNNPSNELTASPVAFFSLDALNPDGVRHFVAFSSRDSTEFAFEDATDGYDFDYNDVVVTASPMLGRPEDVNDFVSLTAVESTFTTSPDASGCPERFGGTFRFSGVLTALPGSPPLTNLRVQVHTLTNGNALQNADSGPARLGTLTIPKTGDYADGVLVQSETVDIPFVICLQDRNPFQFLVNVLSERLGW
jgi:hypothetical protein